MIEYKLPCGTIYYENENGNGNEAYIKLSDCRKWANSYHQIEDIFIAREKKTTMYLTDYQILRSISSKKGN